LKLPYYYSICDNCFNSEAINEEGDIYCDAKKKIIKRKRNVRHCIKYLPIRKKNYEFPKIFLEQQLKELIKENDK